MQKNGMRWLMLSFFILKTTSIFAPPEIKQGKNLSEQKALRGKKGYELYNRLNAMQVQAWCWASCDREEEHRAFALTRSKSFSDKCSMQMPLQPKKSPVGKMSIILPSSNIVEFTQRSKKKGTLRHKHKKKVPSPKKQVLTPCAYCESPGFVNEREQPIHLVWKKKDAIYDAQLINPLSGQEEEKFLDRCRVRAQLLLHKKCHCQARSGLPCN